MSRPSFHYDRDRRKVTREITQTVRAAALDKHSEVVFLLNEVRKISKALDEIKRKVYYVKELKPGSTKLVGLPPVTPEDVLYYKKLHGLIGLIAELNELFIIKDQFGGSRSIEFCENGLEELGDLEWYLGELVDGFKLDRGKVRRKNIEKLRARYGEKFSSERAMKRDLSNEKTVLEGE